MEERYKKFRGGAWISFISATWPFGMLLVSRNEIVLKIEGVKGQLIFTKENLEKIEIKKYLPIIGYGIKFTPKPYRLAYFWYLSFKFNDLTNTLREYGWLK